MKDIIMKRGIKILIFPNIPLLEGKDTTLMDETTNKNGSVEVSMGFDGSFGPLLFHY